MPEASTPVATPRAAPAQAAATSAEPTAAASTTHRGELLGGHVLKAFPHLLPFGLAHVAESASTTASTALTRAPAAAAGRPAPPVPVAPPATLEDFRHRLVQGGERVIRRAEPERRVLYPEDVLAPGDFQRDRRGHARLELEIVVRDVDHGGVGHDVLLEHRFEPDLRDGTLERFGCVGVHGERDHLARANPTDIRLVDVGDDPHLGQVGGNDEQLRRRRAGVHRLPHVHLPGDDDAVDRCRDHRVPQADLVLVQRSPGLDHAGLRRSELGCRRPRGQLRCFELRRGDQVSRGQVLRPRQLCLGIVERYLESREVRLPAGQVRLLTTCCILQM